MPDNFKIKITVLSFGFVRELIGVPRLEIELAEPARVDTAIAHLIEQHPSLSGLTLNLLFAVNERYAVRDFELSDRDTLAIMPQVSGGAGPDIYRISNEPIDPEKIKTDFYQGESGALVTFEGIVRGSTGNRRTLSLEYDVYPKMALESFEQIGALARARWPLNRIAIVHRIGLVYVSEITVVIAVASPHRKDAFDACQYIIDKLKTISPIWKKEHFEDGAVWVDHHS